ncbi:MAG: 4-hydroxythreonine-4-phosphate dehydrogenase PdxA [Rhizobiales bacterium]|nr:4-hydroxythreonine-4-phosphate dehydrogenase PdxA [Hyphomicrobiales bacterium]MBO6698474.1 4-hydroxythreonine-4-phosphate dehydrogenase PdxA [Hyphomicrobiales bacterium]MBO6735272.1 4-hydroxythreonine-4-phosphate dehydrogenase PdxA [Hyphomicrobiales bacterium]MBO6910920.1 4-hydroxythreonine-4-phosphate dehydrogenase PdxA [Hyphomicrobiales bacterium]MBO6955963.1 4-hydroxythreonine-4-phosphate dehydrogenase PdxA [Hyphomicrobiales bacterium]
MPDAPRGGRPLAISMGEPAGVGPDIILQAQACLQGDPEALQLVVFGDPVLLERRAERLGLDVAISVLASMVDLHEDQRKGLAVVDVGRVVDSPGRLDEGTGDVTVSALCAALDAVRLGRCSGLVTAPIHKANLYATGFAFPGHTEFLEAYAHEHWPESNPLAVMMLAGPELRTVPVTVHIPLSEVARSLTTQRIVDVGGVVARDLKQRFDIDTPRLAIAGLNPHAGEQGSLGKEDDAIIAPAITQLGQMGFKAIGPLPADTMFHPEARQAFDAALCMYHDQALIPVKALDFHNTVNVTLGLPFIRTSPDHGTALELAGTGKASPASMVAAIRLAARMAERARESA